MPLTAASSILAMSVTGDIADVTYVQKAGQRRTSFIKNWPNKVPTPAQHAQRTLVAAAVKAWQAETPARRATCNKIARYYRMPMSGYNLYISACLNAHFDWIEDWAKQLKLAW